MANDIAQKKPEKPSPEEQQKPQAGSHPGGRVTAAAKPPGMSRERCPPRGMIRNLRRPAPSLAATLSRATATRLALDVLPRPPL